MVGLTSVRPKISSHNNFEVSGLLKMAALFRQSNSINWHSLFTINALQVMLEGYFTLTCYEVAESMSLFLYFHFENSMMMQEWNPSSGFLLKYNIHHQDGMKFRLCLYFIVGQGKTMHRKSDCSSHGISL